MDDEPQFVVARAAGVSSEDNALTALVQQEKSRSVSYYWPALYADSRNFRSTRNVANALITAGMKDPVVHGGFTSQAAADDCQSIFWGLAEVLLWAMPHVGKFEGRSMPLPQLFVDAAQHVYVNSASLAPVTKLDPAKLSEHATAVAAMQRDGVLDAKFRMGMLIEKLCGQFERYGACLQQHQDVNTSASSKVEDKECGCIRRDNRKDLPLDPSLEGTILRINELLSKSEPYQPVRIDDLLLIDLDLKDVKSPRMRRTRRLKFVMNEVNAISCCLISLSRCVLRHDLHATLSLIATTAHRLAFRQLQLFVEAARRQRRRMGYTMLADRDCT